MKYRINDEITAQEVRVVQMQEESQNGVYSFREAFDLALSLEKDLVEIVPQAKPPVCRIIEISKLMYEEKKKDRERKQQQKQAEMKEIRFGPQTDDHDFDFKTKHALEFLEKGHKVRAFVMFRGRSIVYKDQGFSLLERFIKALEEVGKVETEPRMEGRKATVILVPKNTKLK